ncbi:MAG: YlbF family regulator [Oscillospiraceae bacterium]|jgi:cell fate (sporulation/competence/biofilm development) regulator YlbF (YheA/YmcA/DUF963 family)|nr:YlbF family regulator [Oscillospiraceae bacterium]
MQNIEQMTRTLGAALQLTPEYVRCLAAKEQNDADGALQRRMRELELIRMQYQHEAAKGEQADDARMDEYQARFDELYNSVMQTPCMAEYQAAARELEAVLQRVTGILQGCAQGEDPQTYDPKPGGCGGNCGGCGGCG